MDKKLLFEIQTAQTGKIEISECDYLFEIIEIDCGDQNVIIWKKAFNSFEECVSFLETTTLDYPLKRNFKCWWLYCPIIYLSNDILNNLKKIIKTAL